MFRPKMKFTYDEMRIHDPAQSGAGLFFYPAFGERIKDGYNKGNNENYCDGIGRKRSP